MKIDTYIEFLRWCLHPTVDSPKYFTDIDWHELLTFAKKQTIVGIYWQGMQRLGDASNKPSEDEVMEWMGEYTKIVRKNKKTDEAVASLTKLMNDNGIGFFMFKGQAVARFYPIPVARTSGDVDFYVFKKDWEKAKKVLQERVNIENAYSFRHLEFSHNGIPFEMHYHTAVFASNSRQRYWDKLIDSYSGGVLDHVEINGVEIPTLPPTVNAIYLFTHIYHHFLKEGIALRQFIDWMMFFEAKHEVIVVSELTAKLERLGLLRAFKAFGAVLVDVLGMDAKYFPLAITVKDRRYEDKIMSIVLKYGNFGKYGRKSQHGGWLHSFETGLRSVRHLTRFFWLSPSENLLWLPKLVKHSIIKNTH